MFIIIISVIIKRIVSIISIITIRILMLVLVLVRIPIYDGYTDRGESVRQRANRP